MKTPERCHNSFVGKQQWPEDFCTECGDELEDFCFSGTVDDIDAIREMFSRCKQKHKFTGGSCAKLFIAERSNIDGTFEPEDESINPTAGRR